MNISSDCDPPFILDKDKDCTITVYEFYEPFTYYLKQVNTILDLLILFGLLGILISFLRVNKNHWNKNKRLSTGPDEAKKKFFFKYNLLTILFLLIGAIFHLHLAYNNFIYARDFNSDLAKQTSLSIVYMSIFFHGGVFTLLPILKELLGLTKLSSRYQSVQSVALSLSLVITVPFFFAMPYFVYFEELDFSTFKIICYSHGIINSLLLGIVLYYTVNIVVDGIQILIGQYIREKRKTKDVNKLYTFKVKLKLFKAALTFHIVFLTLISLPNLFSSINTNRVLLLLDSVYLAIIPLELLPSIFLRFILPGSESCFTFDPEKYKASSSIRRTETNQGYSQDTERNRQIILQQGEPRIGTPV
eukprot:snap_masked-scaffold_28-processed-gene-1.12-mRNA-1 protein AED:1.00 eAED:1.00 QI:0/0/0/0/1/1/2/0/359